MNKVFESEVLIRFGDCDPFNHLNNARYVEYFMNAREDHLLEGHGISLISIAAEKGLGWVSTKHQIAYMTPANLGEVVVIQSTLLEWGERQLLLECRMWDRKKTRLKSLLWSEFFHVDLKTQRSSVHNDEMNSLFKKYENPLTVPCDTFEARLQQVRGKTAEEVG